MLDNGDFNGDIDSHTIYAYQEKNGNHATPNYEIINDTYYNIYSDEYNGAWNQARILATDAYIVQAYCGNDAHSGHVVGNHGANALETPMLRVTLTEAQLVSALNNGFTVTVNYRRNAT